MMLQAGGILKAYGRGTLLNNVTLFIDPGDRGGLVGLGECGKTRLLRIIVGEEQADQGSVRTSPSDVVVAYLAQAPAFKSGAKAGDVMCQAIDSIDKAERQLKTIAQRLWVVKGDELNPSIEGYADALTRLETLGSCRARSRVEVALAPLRQAMVDQETAVNPLSGGQETLFGLACLLLDRPGFCCSMSQLAIWRPPREGSSSRDWRPSTGRYLSWPTITTSSSASRLQCSR